MCGRFTLTTSVRDLANLFQATPMETPGLQPHYNIPPSMPVLAVRKLPGDAQRQLVALRWGLIPSWSKDPSIGNRLINARAESAATKPSFREAFGNRRCLILADGFFEWKKQGRKKQPYLIRMRDGKPFAFAGLWECWHPPDDGPVETCAILTTNANELVQPLHDRMPAILKPQDYDRWLNPDVHEKEELEPLLHSCPAEQMMAYPVSALVNSPRHDDPTCVEAIEAPVSEEQPSLF
jgi:putative SOS response-associated peptidase YedK